MSRLKTISDKLDYIAMGKLNAEQMEYICEINQDVNLKNREIERLNNKEEQLIRRLEDLIVVGEQVENEWAIDICKMIIKELKGDDKE